MKFSPVIGLEIHIELKTESKMFCGCSAKYFGHQPNSHCCPVCLGLPGALPVANKKAIEWTILAGLSMGSQISSFSQFDRKNYFYPDLPKGYQISQYERPLATAGSLKFKIQNSPPKAGPPPAEKFKTIRIRRVHLEEDTAKMFHLPGKKYTLIDFNRSGVPLLEIVTEPDIQSAAEAKEFLKKLTQIIRYLEISDCDMEKGSMRLEANISIGEKLPDYKVEIKNLNSFRFVEKAINYEIERQTSILRSGKKLLQETRGWDEKKQVTYSLRVKEEAQDYRYFPEPDIPPLRITDKQISNFKYQISKIELPEKKLARFIKEYSMSEYNAKILTETREKADYFEEKVKKYKKYKISPEKIANVIINKKPLSSLLKTKKSSFTDENLLMIINSVLKENEKAVADFKKGKENAIQFLVGRVMTKTKGQANPKKIKKMITQGVNRGSP